MEASAFEILAEASRRVPEWVGVKRDRFFQRDPGAAIVLVIVTFWGLFILSAGVVYLWVAPLVGLALLLAGVGLSAAAFLAFRRWRRALHEEAARELTMWDRRFEGLRDRMDRFLEEL